MQTSILPLCQKGAYLHQTTHDFLRHNFFFLPKGFFNLQQVSTNKS
jgi:hypothetical protein